MKWSSLPLPAHYVKELLSNLHLSSDLNLESNMLSNGNNVSVVSKLKKKFVDCAEILVLWLWIIFTHLLGTISKHRLRNKNVY